MDPRLAELSATLGKMIHGYQALSLLGAAFDLDLWTPLRQGPKSLAALAQHSTCPPAKLERILSGLTLIGAVRAVHHGTSAGSQNLGPATNPSADAKPFTQYFITNLGQAASDPRLPFADQVRVAVREYAPAWQHLGRAARDDRTPFEAAFGQAVWKHRQQDAETGAAFNRIMARVQAQNAPFIVEHCDLTTCSTLVDVGGGAGRLAIALLTKHTHLRAVIFDQRQVEEAAQITLNEAGLGARARFVSGDFFEAVPEGDALLLQHILHDWGDEDAARILRNCRAAMPSGGKLFLVERLVGKSADGTTSSPQGPDVLRDLHMLCVTGGIERTEAGYAHLLQICGFEVVTSHVSPTGGDILEARAR